MKFSKKQIRAYSGWAPGLLKLAKICPTCFDRASGNSIFGDDSQLKIYEDKDIYCILVNNPRAPGHMMISTKKHFHDMSECPDSLNKKVMCFAKQFMIAIKKVYKCEMVYLCTMCDGPVNHYHVQLIPRYAHEEVGSVNFVKPRSEYVFDSEKFNLLKDEILSYTQKQPSNLKRGNK